MKDIINYKPNIYSSRLLLDYSNILNFIKNILPKELSNDIDSFDSLLCYDLEVFYQALNLIELKFN